MRTLGISGDKLYLEAGGKRCGRALESRTLAAGEQQGWVEGRSAYRTLEGGSLSSSPWLGLGGEKGWFQRSRGPSLGPGIAGSLLWHSLLCHPGVLEGDKDQVQTLQPNAVELGVELICQLLLQLTVILLCIYLGQEVALRVKEARAPGRPRLDSLHSGGGSEASVPFPVPCETWQRAQGPSWTLQPQL